MADFNNFKDNDTEGANVNLTDPSDPTKKAEVDSTGSIISRLKGGTDGTTVGNVSDRLKVEANLNSGQLVPTITNKLRIRYNIGNISLPGGSPGSWITLFTRSGTGLFFGFQSAFNNSDVDLRLTLDSGIVFTIKLDDVRQFQFNDTTTTRTQMGGFLTTIGNVLDFSSKFAIPYTSNLTIEARAASGGSKNNTNWIVFGTEDS